jgi:hypothetical protein
MRGVGMIYGVCGLVNLLCFFFFLPVYISCLYLVYISCVYLLFISSQFFISLTSPAPTKLSTETSLPDEFLSLPFDTSIDPLYAPLPDLDSSTSLFPRPCQCFRVALALLEALSIQNVSITRHAIPRTLRLNKSTLARCRRLLGCARCSSHSSFVMLLIVLAQHLVDAYERVLELLIQQFNESQPSLRFDPPYPGDAKTRAPHLWRRRRQNMDGSVAIVPDNEEFHEGTYNNGNKRRIRLHEYEFDADEEPVVFGGVTRLQLALLKAFLHRIREILWSSNWDAHVVLVDEAVARITEQLALFGTRPGRIFDR